MFKDSSDKEQDKNIKLYEFLIHPFVGVRLITSLMLFYLLLNKLSSIDNLVNIWQATCKERNNKAKKSSQGHNNRFSWINGDSQKPGGLNQKKERYFHLIIFINLYHF